MTVMQLFRENFGYDTAVNTVAPGRVNLIGEHIDYNGGIVLPTVIKNSIHVALGSNDKGIIRIRSSRFPENIECSFDDTPFGTWSDYAVGALIEAKKNGWIEGGIDIAIESTIPDGAGVSSSAALITAILRATTLYKGISVAPETVAQMARSVENDYIGVPCGIMDQMAVNLLDFGQALALDTASFESERIDIPDGWAFVTLHSGIHRALTDGRYKQRVVECYEAREQLKVDHLCSLANQDHISFRHLPTNLAQRTRHVVSEHQRVINAITAMKNNDITAFGTLMHASHRSYAQDFEASTPEIDALVEDAMMTGAIGARLTGGGFGGCIVCLLEQDSATGWTDSFLKRHNQVWQI